jgi:hypothetical protein
MDGKTEQRDRIKFCAILGKSATENFETLRDLLRALGALRAFFTSDSERG